MNNHQKKYQLKKQEIINKNLRNFFETGTKVDKFKVNRNASLEHELKINEIATKLLYEGGSVVVSGKLKNGKIPDLTLIDSENPVIYEIEHSESKESIENKEANYPFRIVHVKIE